MDHAKTCITPAPKPGREVLSEYWFRCSTCGRRYMNRQYKPEAKSPDCTQKFGSAWGID
jgi:hypothetical protein